MYSSNYSPSLARPTTERMNYQSESFHREFYQSNNDLSLQQNRNLSVGLSNSPLTLSPNLPRKYPREQTTGRYQEASYYDNSRPPTNPNRAYSSNDLRQEDPYGSRRAVFVDPDEEIIVKSTDLSSVHEQQIVDLVRTAFRKYDITNQRELAGFLKRSADQRFTSCWHCIVGRQFSSYVTHEMNGFIYMTRGPLSLLLFKSGP